MKKAKMGDRVKIHYKAHSDDGLIFDSSTQNEPMEITIGEKQVIPAFEEALIDMSDGESKIIKIKADKAFGPYLKELISTVEKNQLPKDMTFENGQQLQVQQPDGSTIIVTVKDLSDTHVTLDANHPLAGKDLTFDIQLVEICT